MEQGAQINKTLSLINQYLSLQKKESLRHGLTEIIAACKEKGYNKEAQLICDIVEGIQHLEVEEGSFELSKIYESLKVCFYSANGESLSDGVAFLIERLRRKEAEHKAI